MAPKNSTVSIPKPHPDLIELVPNLIGGHIDVIHISKVLPISNWVDCTAVEMILINLALAMRFASQGRGDYANRLLAMMRNAFGGHAVEKK